MARSERPALRAEDIQAGLDVRPHRWTDLHVVESTGSTNADLVERARTGDAVGAVLVADQQTAGRGRRGRSWTDVPGAQVSMSMAIDATAIDSPRWGWVPLATGLAVLDAVADVAGVRADLKWPNDVLAGSGRGKLAGVLVEVAAAGAVIVIGVGVNVSQGPDELPDAAVSLHSLGAATADRGALVVALLDHVGRRTELLSRPDGTVEQLRTEYTGRSLTVGSDVRVLLPGGQQVTGRATEIDTVGRLVVATEHGPVAVAAGDVLHVRAL